MNSFERKELKRAQASRDGWKTKAKSRRTELRKEKLRNRDLTQSRAMWKERYFSAQNELNQTTSSPLKTEAYGIDHPQIQSIMICFCVTLVTRCSISFRGVPKILSLINDLFKSLKTPFAFKIPHFTTVINWSLRTGLYLLNRANQPSLEPYICLIDHTIQVGTKKALVVLKIPSESFQNHGSLTLDRVQVLFIKIQETSNGLIIQDILEPLFKSIGYPQQIVMDGGADLNKGVRLITENMNVPFKVTYDLTHLIASLLKKKYQKNPIFNELMSMISTCKNKIRQTSLAYLMPKSERTKSRFLNLPSLAQWTKKMFCLIELIPQEPKNQTTLQRKKLQYFAWLLKFDQFLLTFWSEIELLIQLQALLKNSPLNELSYRRALKIIEKIEEPIIKEPLLDYLKTEFEFAQKYPGFTLLTSDIIESLFGKYKFIAKPNAMSEINRMTLILPTICETITPGLIQKAFTHITNLQVLKWIQKNIGSTLLTKRRKAFGRTQVKKRPKAQIIPFFKKTIDTPLSTHFSNGQKMVGSTSAPG